MSELQEMNTVLKDVNAGVEGMVEVAGWQAYFWHEHFVKGRFTLVNGLNVETAVDLRRLARDPDLFWEQIRNQFLKTIAEHIIHYPLKSRGNSH